MRTSILCFLTFALFLFSACNSKTEELEGFDYQTERLNEIMPLAVGKYITYRVDSTVFPNFGRSTEVHKYRIKHLIEAKITDNLGRPSYRVLKSITDSSGTDGWQSAGTYFITPLADRIEVVENNLRIVKLQTPLRLNYSWKGNVYLPMNPYNYNYGTLNFSDTKNWEYTYASFGDEPIGTQILKDVWTVHQLDDITTVPGGLSAVGYAEEKYATGIGLVYKELTLWDEQPNTSGSSPYKIGFGVKMWMIDHN